MPMNADDQACFDQSVRQIQKEQYYAMLHALIRQGVDNGVLWKPAEPRFYGAIARGTVTAAFVIFVFVGGYLSHAGQAGLLFLFGLYWVLAGRAVNRKYQMLCRSLGLEP
jgi:hypothetical protein